MRTVFGLGSNPDYDFIGIRVDQTNSLNLSTSFDNIGFVDRDSVDPQRALPVSISECLSALARFAWFHIQHSVRRGSAGSVM